ncbi:MAG: hypothetical protein GY845_00025 [Planctomycetes bacterium]|nr:hypothetical protein [Planctomycetota bacterium]
MMRNLCYWIILLTMMISMLGCAENEATVDSRNTEGVAEINVATTIDTLELHDVWHIAQLATEVNDSTATLKALVMEALGDRSILFIMLNFRGTGADGGNYEYQVDVDQTGSLKWRQYEIEAANNSGVHPLAVFDELDNFSLNNLDLGKHGTSVMLGGISGSQSFSGDSDSYYNLYVLRNGTLTPLKRIIFQTENRLPYISVSKHNPTESSEEYQQFPIEATAPKPTAQIPPDKRDNEIWVFDRDLVEATTVEYLDQ